MPWCMSSICNPLVNGVGDVMFCMICNLFIIGHLLGENMNEWVKVIATEVEQESDGHIRLGYLD